MGDHALLTARDIHGPYMQLLTNLQAQYGREWLDALKRFNRKENPWHTPRFHMKDGIAYFDVVSQGVTGKEWIDKLAADGYPPDDLSRSLFLSRQFRPTAGLITTIAVLNGASFDREQRTLKSIHDFAKQRKLKEAKAEHVALIRDCVSDKDLSELHVGGILVMHRPLKGPDGRLWLCGPSRYDWPEVGAFSASCEGSYRDTDGFAFVHSTRPAI